MNNIGTEQYSSVFLFRIISKGSAQYIQVIWLELLDDIIVKWYDLIVRSDNTKGGTGMKLSTKGRYGIKAMVDLAVSYSCGCRLSIAQLADKQGISAAYLEQLIGTLKKAGLVTASRGSQGGYSLARAPELISVGDVLKALEGSTTLVYCVGTDGTDCTNVCSCSARPLWLKLQRRIDDVLDSTTIRDMADDYITQTERMN